MSRRRVTGLLCLLALAFTLTRPTAARAWQEAGEYPRHIRTVFLILMENHNWTGDADFSIKGNPSAPYINHVLLPIASHAENYFNPPGNHPSLPNYLWLEAGTNFGIYNDDGPDENHQPTTAHLVTQLEKAGIQWRAYAEDINGKECPLKNQGLYAVRHDPFVYFDDVTGHLNWNSAHCIEHIRPFPELLGDLCLDQVAPYNFIIPNVCDDMHDHCSGDPIAQGDSWLATHVPQILSSKAYQQGGALFILWDEARAGDGPIGMIVLSPFAKGNGYSNNLYYTHGSTLRTLETIFGVQLLRDARHQRSLGDLFRIFP